MSGMLTKLLALAGQVALQQLVYMEVGVLGELKRRNAMQEDKQSKKSKVRQRMMEPHESCIGEILDIPVVCVISVSI